MVGLRTEKTLSVGFILLLALCNRHLLGGAAPLGLIYRAEAVVQGELYRLLSHAFVHVSWYHLLLDAAAVVLLWAALARVPPLLRLLCAGICVLTSIMAVACFSPLVEEVGFCGLSGVAHGLMALTGLIELKGAKQRRPVLGALFLVLSLGKGLYEVVAGDVLLIGFHGGELGIPLVHSHLGGALGGVLSYVVLRFVEKQGFTYWRMA